ncbi:DUF4870 domain-containing protein [Flammeovirga yaeyamensis]|uniref:DUF4870 domain-containing protein n=1 Tax=Flammeovirga yaeyamensis TaxID=367791 RepID=A0AAX1NDV1_9BACT|nr:MULTISPECIES: DUF4870 domain-containing protein [Flammeovirga]ANQ52094.1 DUF4870 domain-containing protein [Flammeovirga sp. MY04]MBB3699239.1 transcriptional regulator with XRE-family HTH domain [Flammeovirga yaeyamensis]NMF35498.1 DUF4870 domain-containing protein [Flammeovirga yaeyamensis]QWG04357.1 DUF4870 domain-containing protein [Flammeovirga yaeyamensis]
MNNYIRSIRFSKGLTQKSLSQRSTLPLWHIQMIENNVIIPTENDLLKISTVLDVNKEELITSEELDRKQLSKIYLSVLSMFIIPFGNIIGPSYFMSVHLNLSSKVRSEGNKFVNFQLIWSVITSFIFILLIIYNFKYGVNVYEPLSLWFSLTVLLIFNLGYSSFKFLSIYK